MSTNIQLYPEKYAKLLCERRSLVPPIDVEALIKEYAELIYDIIPIPGIDGVSLNIKVPGETTKVIVNNSIPITRQRFTLAHELGHIIIPWHVGDLIIDLIQVEDGYLKDPWAHQEIERQANQFAAELLMPSEWVKSLFISGADLAQIHKVITDQCIVSPLAAALRIIDLHESAVAFCETDILRMVNHFGQSNKSKLVPVSHGKRISIEQFDRIKNQYSACTFHHSSFYHWWIFEDEDVNQHLDERSWREILDQIIDDCKIEDSKTLKFRLNGVIAHENSVSQRLPSGEHNPENLFTATLRRLVRDEFKQISEHPDFKKFVAKRVNDFFPNN
jgi:Zn-dependent peptidase ImmA (M78 family)